MAAALVAAAAGWILWSELRTSAESRDVVARALERANLITRMRVGAMALEAAVEAQLRAPTPVQRAEAAELMDQVLRDLQEAQSAYLELLRSKREPHLLLWRRFDDACQALSESVRHATATSDVGAARRHFTDTVRPQLVQVDALAAQLARENADSAARISEHLDALRSRSLRVGGSVLLGALAIALLLGMILSRTLVRQEQVIARQLELLDRRNRELDAFAGRVAHDLLSPLAPLRGYLTVVRRAPEVRSAPHLSESLDRALSSTDQAAGLVEALLRFHRSGQRADASAGALDSVVTAQLMEVEQAAQAQGVRIERALERGVSVACPAQLLQSLAQNLLSNAVKYTAGAAEARVRVRVAQEGGRALLAVEDNGRGMAAEVVAQLGTPFYRAPEVRQTHRGFGLGLAICRRLVEAHGGSLEVESAPGRGTTVRAWLPLAAPGEAPLPQVIARAEPQS